MLKQVSNSLAWCVYGLGLMNDSLTYFASAQAVNDSLDRGSKRKGRKPTRGLSFLLPQAMKGALPEEPRGHPF